MIQVFVPAYSEELHTVDTFTTQIIAIPQKYGCIVTGSIDSAVTDSVYLAISILEIFKKYFKLHRSFNCTGIHIHFTNYDMGKFGSSAGLGVFLTILSFFSKYQKFRNNNMKILATGEIDLYGNIIEVGAFQKKAAFFINNTNLFDVFLYPNHIAGINNGFRVQTIFDVYNYICGDKNEGIVV